jgi:hypothetical protein
VLWDHIHTDCLPGGAWRGYLGLLTARASPCDARATTARSAGGRFASRRGRVPAQFEAEEAKSIERAEEASNESNELRAVRLKASNEYVFPSTRTTWGEQTLTPTRVDRVHGLLSE